MSRAYQNDQALASWLGDHDDRLTDLESGTSGSSNLTVVSGSVTLDDGVDVGTLVGYRVFGSATFTGQGGSVELAAGVYIFERVTGSWTYRTIDEGTGLTPDTTNPTAGTLAVSGVTHDAATLTVTGASDNQALHATPYAFSTNNGSAWTGWQASNVYAASGLTPSTAYNFRHKVRDAQLNEATGVAVSATTAAIPAVPYEDEVLADSPVVYFPLGDSAGPAVDQTGTATATDIDSPTYGVAGIGDRATAVAFDATDAISFGRPAALDNLTTLTVEAIIRPTALSGFAYIVNRSAETGSSSSSFSWLLRLSENKIQFYRYGGSGGSIGSVTGTTSLAIDTVYHVAATYDGSAFRVYVNGVPDGESAVTGSLGANTSHPHKIGRATANPAAGGVQGTIAGVAIYDSALSAARILAHAQAAGVTA